MDKKLNKIIFVFVIIMMVFSVYLNSKAIIIIDEISKMDVKEVTGKAFHGSVSICFNEKPILVNDSCSGMVMQGDYNGNLRGEYSCYIQMHDPDGTELVFTENQRIASLRQTALNRTDLLLSGRVGTDENLFPNNVTVNVTVCDRSGCDNDCIDLSFQMFIEYLSQVILIQKYPTDYTDELHISDLSYGSYYYHNSMYSHFLDLDGLDLTFTWHPQNIVCLDINVNFDPNTSQVVYSLNQPFDTSDTGPCIGYIRAENPYGYYNQTNLFHIFIEPVIEDDDSGEIEKKDDSGGKGGSSSGMGASNWAELAEFDDPKKCIISNINCTNWSECVYYPKESGEILNYSITRDGLMKRKCTWLTNCPGDMMPAMKQVCDYKPTCNDSMKNCHELENGSLWCEEDVDCGGPCEACPTCFDLIRNCHRMPDGTILCEEGIDCGGPCSPCSTCSDGIRNCHTMPDGSVLCEEGIDCGGPCNPCATCFDGIKNCHYLPDGRFVCEEGIDCGGPCENPCLSLEHVLFSNRPLLFNLMLLLLIILALIFTSRMLYPRLHDYFEMMYMNYIKKSMLNSLLAQQKAYLSHFDKQLRSLSGNFDDFTDREVKEYGDRLLFEGQSTGYNIDRYSVSFENDYADVLRDNSVITINYAMYIGKINHGRMLLSEMVKHGLKPNYKICKRSSAVLWDEAWDRDQGVTYESKNGMLIARTIEYVISFQAKDNEEAQKISKVIDLFVKGRIKNVEDAWDVPDIRITGNESVPYFQKRILNTKKIKGQNLIVLTKDKSLEGFENNSIWLNSSLAEFIK